MSKESIQNKRESVKNESKNYLEIQTEIVLKLDEFLSNPSYHYGLIGSPGIGKSSATISYLKQHDKKFLYVAATKPTAHQLKDKFNLPFYFGKNKIPQAKQMITIYDWVHKFVDFRDLAKTKETILVVDEAANIIQQRLFRKSAIRIVETYRKYFDKVIYLTATPIDYRAYGEEFNYIFLEDDSCPITMYRKPHGKYATEEIKDIANLAAKEKRLGFKSFIYLQDKKELLPQLIKHLEKLEIKSISVFNSDESVWKTQDLETDDLIIETSQISGEVLITTYADGFNLIQKGFSFICCSWADVHTVYQAMNRVRLGCERYYLMSNAYQDGGSYQEIKKRCDALIEGFAIVAQETIMEIPDLEARLAYIDSEKIHTVTHTGELDWAGIAKLSIEKQQENFETNFEGLRTAFLQYNINLVKDSREIALEKLTYKATDLAELIKDIYQKLDNLDPIPNRNPWKDELAKIRKLEAYLSSGDVRQFMLNDYITSPSSYDIKYRQLQLKDNPIDCQLKERLQARFKQESKPTPKEFNAIVAEEKLSINYPTTDKTPTKILVKGLGIDFKETTKRDLEGNIIKAYSIL